MYRFHITIHAHPQTEFDTESLEISGHRLTTLSVRPDKLDQPMGASFEQATAALATLPRMIVEPDGSFVWTFHGEQVNWQVDGCLFDRNGRLLYVDLKGSLPEQQFDQLLAALSWPETPLLFQLTRQAVFLAEDEFRRFASADC